MTICTDFALANVMGAIDVAIFIKEDTTPKEFDEEFERITNHPRCYDYSLESSGHCGWTALGVAASVGNVELVSHIFFLGGPKLLHQGNLYGHTPLYSAICECKNKEKRMATVKRLLENGSDINMGSSCNHNPLWSAIEDAKDPELIKFLIGKGAMVQPDTYSKQGKTFLESVLDNDTSIYTTICNFIYFYGW